MNPPKTKGIVTFYSQDNTCEVRIRLKLEPVEEKAYVDTWTKISGFSMHLEGEVPLQDTP